ncbi:MAG: hypothetical protein VKJ46_05510 [Leptolyngbyaceae bacterium]|nr:hypothetical protein [Leptolyngbyaceae bacterium]
MPTTQFTLSLSKGSGQRLTPDTRHLTPERIDFDFLQKNRVQKSW